MSDKAQIAAVRTGALLDLLTCEGAAESIGVKVDYFERHVLPELPVRRSRDRRWSPSLTSSGG